MKTPQPLRTPGSNFPDRRSFLQGVVAGLVLCPLRHGLDLVDLGRPSPSRSQEAERLVQLGILQSERGEYPAAIAAFTQALDLDPDCWAAYRHRGKSWLAANNYCRAVDDFTTAIRLDPTDEEAFDWRGVAFKMMYEDGKAVADRTAIIRLNPSALNFYMRGFYALGYDDDLAVADLTEAIRQNPQDALAYSLRAEAHENNRDYRLAAADYAEYMRLDPNAVEWTAVHFRRVTESAS